MAKKDVNEDKKRIRYTIDFPCVIDDRIQKNADALGITKAEFIRKALRTLDNLQELAGEGYNVGGWKTDDKGNRDSVRLMLDA